MKNIKYIWSFLFVSSLLWFTSCGEDAFTQVAKIDLPEHKSALAINAHFDAGETDLEVYVSHSLSILDSSSYQLINDAKVELYKNGNFFYELNPINDKGFYNRLDADPLGVEEATYRLEISAPNYNAVVAEQTMPSAINISNVEFNPGGSINFDGETADELLITIDDPAGIENYYAFQTEFEIDTTNQLTENYGYSLDSEDLFAEYSRFGILLRDATFDGQKYIMRFTSYSWNGFTPRPGDKIIISAIAITKDKYLFESTKSIYNDSQGNPFAEPVVIHENIEDGHGIFSLGNTVIKEFVF